MSEPDSELADIFRDEAMQRLDHMDEVLLAIESGQADAQAIDSLFRDAHTIKGAASMLGLDDIRALAHAAEDILASVRRSGVLTPDIAAPLLRATAALRAMVTGSGGPVDGVLDDLAESRAGLARAGAARAPIAAPEVAAPEVAAPEVAAPEAAATEAPAAEAPAAEAHAAEAHPARARTAETAAAVPDAGRAPGTGRTMRVSVAKIDHLVDAFGEFMQYRRRMVHTLAEQSRLTPEMADMLSGGAHMLDDLKDTAVRLRTLPLSAIIGPLPHAVRDIAHAAGKEVDFVVSGADTEIDRVILESLSEPLTHLLRNAVGHGIESPAEREQAGKARRGRVELRAVSRGSTVEIVVADDGRGVSPDVAEKARREGPLADLLTRAGYSTAGEVTELAGRGVGLDAVKTYATSVRGSLEIRSEPGRGMDVVLSLPLSLALVEALLFERGGAAYGVPTASVEEVVIVSKTLVLLRRPALEVHGRSLPVVDVAAVLGAQAPPLRDRSPGVVVSAAGHQVIMVCDVLLGIEEVMIKPLGLARTPGYLGASILGDGRIALLIESVMLTRGPPPASGRAVPDETAGPAPAPKVLVVEDSFTVRELQRSILEAAGYPVATARDGRDALAVLGRDRQIGLVITDLEMPELDGIELTRAIRGDPARSSLPVVIVTSRGTEEDRRKGIAAGADAYMAKHSFDQHALLECVERLLGR